MCKSFILERIVKTKTVSVLVSSVWIIVRFSQVEWKVSIDIYIYIDFESVWRIYLERRMMKLRIKILLVENVSFSSHASSMSIKQEQGIEEKIISLFLRSKYIQSEFLLKGKNVDISLFESVVLNLTYIVHQTTPSG